jgi:hypothetical protein
MVAAAERITISQERTIYDLLFARGAFTPEQIAAELALDVVPVEAFLADRVSRLVIDYDPRFGRYAMFD